MTEKSNRKKTSSKRGPATAEGKAVSVRNRTKHGVLAGTVPITIGPLAESVDEWGVHLDQYRDTLDPRNAVESDLVTRVAAVSWRLRRLYRYESAALGEEAQGVVDAVEDYGSGVGFGVFDSESDGKKRHDMMGRLKVHQDLHEKIKTAKNPVENYEVAEACVEELVYSVLREGEIPDDIDAQYEALKNAGWTDAKMLAYGRQNAEEVMQEARERIAEIDTRTRERAKAVVPEGLFEQVCRYESHLSRELARTLATLQALSEMDSGFGVKSATLSASETQPEQP